MKLFVIILRYIAEDDAINTSMQEHLNYIHSCYTSGIFILSGPMNPKLGSIILSEAVDRKTLMKTLQKDPFFTLGLCEFSVDEFLPSRYHRDLNFFSHYL